MPGAYRLTVNHPGRAAGQRIFWAEPGDNNLLPLVLVPSAPLGGRVLDDLGQPVAGARIRSLNRKPPRGLAVEARTDKEGRFLLDGLGPGLHRLEVSAKDHAVSVVSRVRAPARAMEVILTRLYSVRGQVVPMPPGGGEVTVRLAGSGVWPERLARPDSSGQFVLEDVPAGIYDMLAGTGQQPWMASAPVQGIAVGPKAPAPVRLELKPAQKITGQVNHNKAPVAGAVVVLGQDSLSVLRARVVTDKEGMFALGPVPLGTYSLGVWATGLLPIPEQGLELPLAAPLNLELSRGATVTGVVHDDQGVPLSDAVIWVVYGVQPLPLLAAAAVEPRPDPAGELGIMPGPVPPIPPSGAWSASGETGDAAPARSSGRTDAAGAFTVAGLWPGRLRVIADLTGYMQVRGPWLNLESDVETTLEAPLVLMPSATLAGRVLDPLGVPLSGARVDASFGDGHRRVSLAGSSGLFRLEGLAGKVELSVSREGYLPLTREVDLTRGEGWPLVELDLVLTRATGQITGLVLDARRLPLAGVEVEASWGKHKVQGRSGRNGRFKLEGVGQGSLTLSVAHPGFLPLSRTGVKAGERVELRLGYAAAVEGEVRDRRTGGPIKAYDLDLAGQGRAAKLMIKRKKRGRFRLEEVAPGSHTLEASAPGYARLNRKIKVSAPGRPGAVGLDGLVLELKRAGIIKGQVFDTRRKGVAKAAVTAGGVTVKTSRKGYFKLEGVPEGNHRVKVTVGKQSKQTDAVVVRAGEITRGVRIELD